MAGHTQCLSPLGYPQIAAKNRNGHIVARGWSKFHRGERSLSKLRVACSTETPKGFGKRPPPSTSKTPSVTVQPKSPSEKAFQIIRDSGASPGEDSDDVIPEVVTNRMLKRITVTVGMPLLFGLGFFPLFWYLKVVQKVDIPDWLPLISSSLFFGWAAFGISYGVISTSWDPDREGTLLGWKEARANWPVFTQAFSRKKR